MSSASWLEDFAAPDRWRLVLLSRGPQIATWILAIAVGVQAALIVTDLAGASRVPEAAPPASLPPPAAARRRVNVAAITNAHLFGNAAPDPAAVNAADAPRTSMPLVLTGIIAAEDPRMGLAIIGESPTAARVYAIDDSVPGGARLHSVYSDRVLLERNGRVESLTLPRQEGITGVAPPPPPAAEAGPAEESAVDRVRQMVANEPALLSDIMRPQPVFAQGKQRGYRVYPGRNRQAFIRLGLRPGDLVVAVNGTPLDDPARGEEIFRTIGSSSEARVTVMRNGRQQDLTLNMAEVASEAEQILGTESAVPLDQASQTPGEPDQSDE